MKFKKEPRTSPVFFFYPVTRGVSGLRISAVMQATPGQLGLVLSCLQLHPHLRGCLCRPGTWGCLATTMRFYGTMENMMYIYIMIYIYIYSISFVAYGCMIYLYISDHIIAIWYLHDGDVVTLVCQCYSPWVCYTDVAWPTVRPEMLYHCEPSWSYIVEEKNAIAWKTWWLTGSQALVYDICTGYVSIIMYG